MAANERLALTQLAFSACVGLTMAAGTAAAVYIGARAFPRANLLGDVLVFLAYLECSTRRSMPSLRAWASFCSARTQLARARGSWRPLRRRPTGRVRSKYPGFADVWSSVAWASPTSRWVMRDVDIVVPAGQVVAHVGRTGRGQEHRLPASAQVLRPDEAPCRRLRPARSATRLAAVIGLMLQDAIPLSGTIAENIGCGRPAATRQQINEAARRAAGRRVHPGPAGRLRDDAGRTRGQPLGRSEAAARPSRGPS